MKSNTNITADKARVEEFYDSFKEQQIDTGINIRHRTILRNLKRAGLKSDSKVFEIGCGIGTFSSLILKQIRNGKLLSVDISPESVDQARKSNAKYRNARFEVSDMTDFQSEDKYDFVVLPDVLEHIPETQHADLFRTISNALTENGIVLINLPEPNCLEWMRKHHPEKLQIIDQSLNLSVLISNAHNAGLHLHSLIPYALDFKVPDYISIVMKKNPAVIDVKLKSYLARGIQNRLSKIFY